MLIAAGSFCLDEGDSLQLASQTTPVLDDPARLRSESDESALITWQTAADRGGAAPGETKPGSWGRGGGSGQVLEGSPSAPRPDVSCTWSPCALLETSRNDLQMSSLRSGSGLRQTLTSRIILRL